MTNVKINKTGEIVDVFRVEIRHPDGLHQILEKDEFELLQDSPLEQFPAYWEHQIYQISKSIIKGLCPKREEDDIFTKCYEELAEGIIEVLKTKPDE